MTKTYSVQTERFGTVNICADDIRDARRRAKLAFRVAPGTVTASRAYTPCRRCDSAPCTCEAS